MPKCQHGMEDCIHINHEHDEDCCFNGMWRKEYICQSCGYSKKVTVYSKIVREDGTYAPPRFSPKNCPKCKAEKDFV